MDRSTSHLVPLLLLLTLLGPANSARILLFPFVWKSHVGEFKHIGEALVDKGHDVHMVLPNHFPGVEEYKANSSQVKALEYVPIHPDYLTWSVDDTSDLFVSVVEMTPIEDFRINTEGFVEICYNVLESKELEQRIRDLKFDLVVLDGFPMTRCYMILAYRLDLPYVSVTTQYEPWLYRNPALPSFVPFPLGVPPLTPEMTFWQRVSNTWILFDWTYHTKDIVYLQDELVTKYAPNKPAVSINDLAGKSLLWLFDTDNAIDYPRPMMPNEINIGGLSVKPSKPLPKDLDTFVSSASKGTIIASFGSNSAIPENYMLIIVEAFKMLDSGIHVIFRWNFEKKPDVPKNIRLMEWVPQSDILGHKNIKLFITHCGANGQFEALYHGVPMVNIPVFGDQPYNAKRADYHGISETLDILSLTSKDLHTTIMKVLSSPSYRENIQKASAVFRSQPHTPRERAAFWVEHVLQFGGQHLRSHALDMPAYQYLMLDILALLLLVLCVGLFLICSTCSLLIKVCRAKKTPDQQQLINNNEYVKKKQ